MRFVVASYGPKHIGMLLTHLQSVVRSHPAAVATVYWQDVPVPLIDAVRAAFPRFDFVHTGFDFSHDFLLRISSKLHAWCRAVEEHAGEAEIGLFDVDTLVLSDLAPFFAKHAAEIIFTDKPERTPLNTGVMLVRGGAASAAFFRAWRERTLHILRTPDLYRQANDYALGYGAADQMALFQMIGYAPGRTDYEFTAEEHPVRLRAEPCAALNETNSRPLSDAMHVIHYKSGWQPILLQGRPFTRQRTRAQSWEMFTLYLARFREALEHLNAMAGTRFTARDFGIVVPFYYKEKTAGFDCALYALWRAREAGKSALGTLRRAAQIAGGALSRS